METLSFETLVDYLNGDLSGVDLTAVEKFLQANPAAQQELEDVRQTLANLQEYDLVEPAPSLLGRVQAAFRRKQGQRPDRAHREASLQFDSWSQPLPVGVRGVPQERQLLFHEGLYDLDLQVVNDRVTNAYVMRGQLLHDSSPLQQELEGIALNLHNTTNGLERRSLTDHYGRFSFSDLDQGIYILMVALESYDMVIVLDSLSITG